MIDVGRITVFVEETSRDLSIEFRRCDFSGAIANSVRRNGNVITGSWDMVYFQKDGKDLDDEDSLLFSVRLEYIGEFFEEFRSFEVFRDTTAVPRYSYEENYRVDWENTDKLSYGRDIFNEGESIKECLVCGNGVVWGEDAFMCFPGFDVAEVDNLKFDCIHKSCVSEIFTSELFSSSL